MAETAERTPVLIVGGGPVGLTASILLARLGVPSVLVERRQDVTRHPRSRAITIRSCEIFRSCDVFDELRGVSLPKAWTEQIIYATTLAGPELGRMHAGGWDQATHGSLTPVSALMSSQDRIEPILKRRAAREPCATLRFRNELVDLARAGDGVRATVHDHATGRPHQLDARYVIAADGASSPIRQRLGIGLDGAQGLAHLMNTYYRADLDRWVGHRPAALYFIASADLAGVFQPLDGRDRWLCQIQYDPASDPPGSFTPERCAAWIRRAVGSTDVGIEILSIKPWTLGAAIAERLRTGPVFLAGDAAHQLPPTGGFGMNTGIQDAHNLAWKLAGVLRGWAGPALLDTYETERAPVARVNIARSLENFLMVAQIGAAARAQANARQERASDPGASTPGRLPDADTATDPAAAVRGSRRYGNFLGLDLGFAYENGAVIPDGSAAPEVDDSVADYVPTARPGHRAPHIVLERVTTEVSTLDLFGTAFPLLAGRTDRPGSPRPRAWPDPSPCTRSGSHPTANSPIVPATGSGAMASRRRAPCWSGPTATSRGEVREPSSTPRPPSAERCAGWSRDRSAARTPHRNIISASARAEVVTTPRRGPGRHRGAARGPPRP